MESDKSDWSYLSKYRNSIYGVSIILVILFHFFDRVRHLNGAFSEIARLYWILIGSVGVDIFLIMSGMSLFYSMKKHSNVLEFYKKRCKRIIIPYLIIGFIYWYIKDIAVRQLGIKALLKDLFFVTFFTDGDRSLWFIIAIIIIYLIYPLLFKIYDKIDKGNDILTMLLIGSIVGLNYLAYLNNKELYDNIEIMLTRFPAIVLGTYCGKKAYNKASIRKLDIGVIGASISIDLAISFYRILKVGYIGEKVLRYIQIARGIVVIFLIVLLFSIIKNKRVEELTSIVGNYSLELYLIHVSIFELFDEFGVQTTKCICFLIIIIITAGLAQAFRRISDRIYKFLE